MGLGAVLQIGYFLLTVVLAIVCLLYSILIYRAYNTWEVKRVLRNDKVTTERRSRARAALSKIH